jgi:glycerate kinase
VIPTVLLVAPGPFNRQLSASRAASAIARGLEAAGWRCDVHPLADGAALGGAAGAGSSVHAAFPELEATGFDRLLRAARAVVTGAPRLDRHHLTGSTLAEVATRARQAGVPCYAIVGADRLDRFDKRILDLEAVLEARTFEELERAGVELASLL